MQAAETHEVQAGVLVGDLVGHHQYPIAGETQRGPD